MNRVRLHTLDSRPDGDEWIVGRRATGRFVALPEVGKHALDLLGQGLTPAEGKSLSAQSTRDRLDGIAVVVTLGAVHALWLRTWWRSRRLRRTPSRPSR